MRDERPPIRAIRGPIILITVGALFVLQNFTNIDFGQTWPVLLIVIGLLSLLGRSARTAPPGQPPVPPPPNYNWPPPAGDYRGTPYSHSPYAQPGGSGQAGAAAGPGASAPAKGGFGGSAPPRDNPPPAANSGDTV